MQIVLTLIVTILVSVSGLRVELNPLLNEIVDNAVRTLAKGVDRLSVDNLDDSRDQQTYVCVEGISLKGLSRFQYKVNDEEAQIQDGKVIVKVSFHFHALYLEINKAVLNTNSFLNHNTGIHNQLEQRLSTESYHMIISYSEQSDHSQLKDCVIKLKGSGWPKLRPNSVMHKNEQTGFLGFYLNEMVTNKGQFLYPVFSNNVRESLKSALTSNKDCTVQEILNDSVKGEAISGDYDIYCKSNTFAEIESKRRSKNWKNFMRTLGLRKDHKINA